MPIDLDHDSASGDWLKRPRAPFTSTGTTRISTGRRRQAAVTWNEDGTLSGDIDLLAEADRRVIVGERVKATPSGPARRASLTPLEAAAVLLSSLFETFEQAGGFPLHLLDVDEGEIS